MRENFSRAVKQKLAGRVNYKCCFPGCTNVTIGPSGISSDDVVILGEAAHIYAASLLGPRADPDMPAEFLSSIQNGIWMCRNHARLIDADTYTYSAETLLTWKNTAEAQALEAVKNSNAEVRIPTTLIALNDDVVLEAFWIEAAENDRWTFEITRFLYGNEQDLKVMSAQHNDGNFICIESEGDGRFFTSPLSWQYDSTTGIYTFSVTVADRYPRITLSELGSDIKLDEDGDIEIVDGDFSFTSGNDLAAQLLQQVMSAEFMIPFFTPAVIEDYITTHNHGHRLHTYFTDHAYDIQLLGRLFRLYLSRLIALHLAIGTLSPAPPLNFIGRIISLEVISAQPVNNKIPVSLKLQWLNGNYWHRTINISVE